MVANRTDHVLRHPVWVWAWEWGQDQEDRTQVAPTDPRDHPGWAWVAECHRECDLRIIIRCPVQCTCKDHPDQEALRDLRVLRCITETGPHSRVLPASRAKVASGMDRHG